METEVNLKEYLLKTLPKQIALASAEHKRLKQNRLRCKVFEHNDLVAIVYLKAYDSVQRTGKPLTFEMVKRLCRNAGYQAYREHHKMFRSHYTLAELEDMGTLVGFPMQTEGEERLTGQHQELRRLLGLTSEPSDTG